MANKKDPIKGQVTFSEQDSFSKEPKTKEITKPSTTASQKQLTDSISEPTPVNIMKEREKISTDSSGLVRKKGPVTRIIVKYDVGFNNSVYLRGDGADLCWDRGIMLKNVKSDEWIWETNVPFNKCEFKVLINDRQYELGENHRLLCGTSFEYTPNFHRL